MQTQFSKIIRWIGVVAGAALISSFSLAGPMLPLQYESELMGYKSGTYPKRIVVKYYKAVDKGTSIEIGDATASIYEVLFNEHHQANRFCEYSLEGDLKEMYERTFNESGLLKTEQKKGKDRLVVLSSEYVYQNSAKESSLQTQKIYNADKKLLYTETYQHDKAGNTTSMQRVNETGAAVYSYEYSYDNKNRIEREIRLNAQGGKVSEQEYEYDSYGNKTAESRYNAQGKMTQHIEYEYWDNALTKSMTLKVPQGPMTYYRIEYEYDSRGNWIKQTVFKGPDVPTSIVIRKLEYF